MTNLHKRIYTVTDLTRRIKELLEREFDLVWVEGEVSNLRPAASGHLYFTLKDRNAQISAVMFKGQARHLKFSLEDGLSIVGLGRVSVYEPRGSYQVILELIEPKGLGSLQIAFEQLKEKLAAEGLFDADRKKPLPFLPRRVCLITSPGGAVVHDMLHVLHNRYPNLEVDILPVRVQGEGAADEIVHAIETMNRIGSSDVAILARGGGSLEDLQPFNTEKVARAICTSAVPIVSAVGHETDFTIADFVADERAPTPTAAAARVIPEKRELIRRIEELRLSAISRMAARLHSLRENLQATRRRLVNPRRRLDDFRLKVDDGSARMEKAIHRRISLEKAQWTVLDQRLMKNPLIRRLALFRERLQQIDRSLVHTIRFRLSSGRSNLLAVQGRIRNLDPMAVLNRGYSITRMHPEGTIVRDAGIVPLQKEVDILLARGRLVCRVEGVDADDPQDI
ncbi:MAG: exodeoxyribonuclease VII large subunit [Desulfobacterales bacterium]